MPELLSNLPVKIREQVRKTSCNLIFRFGNHQTLPSKTALLLPLCKTWIRIAIVQGNTPFLLSSSFLKHIKAVIDTEQGTLWSKLLNCSLPIEQSNKNLFLLDVNNLWSTQESKTSSPEIHQAGVCETTATTDTSDWSKKESLLAEPEDKAISEKSTKAQHSCHVIEPSVQEVRSRRSMIESAVRKSESITTERDASFNRGSKKLIWEPSQSAERLRQPCHRR